MSAIEKHIAQIKLQLRIQALLKALMLGLALVFLLMIFFESYSLIIGIATLAMLGFSYGFGVFQNYHTRAVSILHAQFPTLEFSSELLGKPNKNIAEQLQWERVNAQFKGGSITLWNKGLSVFLVGVLFTAALYASTHFVTFEQKEQVAFQPKQEESSSQLVNNIAVQLLTKEVHITPPAYTGLPQVSQSDLEVKALKGSTIEWEVSFSTSESLQVELKNSQGVKLPFILQNERYVLKDRIVGSGIYAIEATQGEELVYQSNFYTLEAVEDAPPVIIPGEKDLYSYHFAKDPQTKTITATVSDDFLVSEVYLVATLARGSGENVKFRESRMPVATQSFKSKELSVNLNYKELDFKQGDELYYYWSAIDNRTPNPNFARSDTYFINYVDSTGMTEAQLVGMAIHVMPDFFRSQRQIIIDTEKLISQKNKISDTDFNRTSNEIGYDQKLLRMRYGQYLGEEEESNAGGGEIDPDAEDMLAGYRHDHDHENEAGITASIGAVEEKHVQEEQATSSSQDNALSSLLDAYLHNHEAEDANTFYEESTRGTLKLALEQMWQSELYLRLFEPEKALPYQEKALEYLKTVQQKSRVYVKRTGFDPPPIKEEEKRLQGDLDKIIKNISMEQKALESKLAPLAAQVLGLLPKAELSVSDHAVIQKLGELWTARMNYSGLEDWSVLLLLQELNTGNIDAEGKGKLFDKLYPLVKNNVGTDADYLQQKELEKAFWSNLK